VAGEHDVLLNLVELLGLDRDERVLLRVGDALRAEGFTVRDFTADVRDGVPYSSITCTVPLSSAEAAAFAQRLTRCPSVVSVEPC